MKSWVASSETRGRMIFVVGAQRSGTNWMQRILTAHPDVVGLPNETELFSLGIAPLMERFHHGAIGSYRLGSTYIDRDELDAALRRFCDTVFASAQAALSSSATRLLERSPTHVQHLELMGRIYPDAHFVHIIRDGRDVVRSLVSQYWGPDSIAEAAAQWRLAIDNAFWAREHLDHYHEIRYEELLTSTREQAADLFDRLHLEHTGEVIDLVEQEARFRYNVDPSDTRVASGKWKSTLSATDVAIVERVAGDTLRELGYAQEPAREHAPDFAPEVTASRAPVASRVRRAATGLLRRAPTHGSRDRLAQAHRAQEVFDQVLETIAARKFDSLDALMADVPRISVLEDGEKWEGSGPAALSRMKETLATDAALAGKQVFGDTWPGSPAVAVLAYNIGETTHDRLLLVYTEGERVTRMAYYKLPIRRV